MMSMLNKFVLFPLLVSFAGAAVAGPAAIRMTDAWVPEPPSVSRNAVAYITLVGGEQDDVLLGASTPAAEVVELHETSLANGMLRMRPVASLAVQAGKRVEFTPGSLHMMLISLRQPLRYGQKVSLELRFEKAGKQLVEAEVRSLPPAPMATGAESHHHHH